MRRLTELALFRDRLSYLYLEKGHIEQDAKSIAFVTKNESIPVPAADLALLMLGPGTTISHAAIRNLADCDCLVAWVGETGVRMYCYGKGGTYHSARLIRQAELATHPRLRHGVVRRMYEKRFDEKLDADLDIRQIRGLEGHRVRSAYQRWAAEFGIEWKGRNYDPTAWGTADPLNRALSAASSCLNGVVHAAITSIGYSPALGFVHTGKMLSFVYDVADLYKVDHIVPLAFRVVAEDGRHVERRARLACRDFFQTERLLESIPRDIDEVLHGRDDTGASPSESKGGLESLDDRTEGRDIPWSHEREGP
ncbi:CRISPR-associated endonuclease Cas1 [Planctomycetes bacterium Pan216]|uniref:CRISPR-associated endonuclease Cas1 n=1 Tax=Kolteria novifilia TaxID=2527975 RepID=A0A518B0G0_9BACT|nr:CRISPR-associated endonuclease Cas1 [Planctomycetes bacterium Pan216]